MHIGHIAYMALFMKGGKSAMGSNLFSMLVVAVFFLNITLSKYCNIIHGNTLGWVLSGISLLVVTGEKQKSVAFVFLSQPALKQVLQHDSWQHPWMDIIKNQLGMDLFRGS